MATPDNVQLIHNFYQALNQNHHEQALACFDSNAEFVMMSMPEEPMRGMQQIQQAFEGWTKAFPQLKYELKNVVGAGEYVISESYGQGTHDGPMEGPEGVLNPTHRKINVPSCDVFKVVNGKIVSWRCYWQTDLMMKQLGLGLSQRAAA